MTAIDSSLIGSLKERLRTSVVLGNDGGLTNLGGERPRNPEYLPRSAARPP